jgi:hypothetical protein
VRVVLHQSIVDDDVADIEDLLVDVGNPILGAWAELVLRTSEGRKSDRYVPVPVRLAELPITGRWAS